MTALSNASFLCRELDERNITYQLFIVRDDALMLSVAVPGERWEIEFFDDGHVELERFISEGVNDSPVTHDQLLAMLEQRI